MIKSSMFDPKQYWEDRLQNAYGLHGVGHKGLGLHYNKWLYRLRGIVFKRAVKKIITYNSIKNVLDIGSGTGFYIQRWKELGVEHITGSDITEIAVSNLRKLHPDVEVTCFDIGDECIKCEKKEFDAISVFDVLFHIVDDKRYEKALQNIHSLLKPGGFLLWSDNFLQNNRRVDAPHQVSRSYATISEILKRIGFEIIKRKPMFWLMNTPLDTTNKILWKYWRFLEKFVGSHERCATIVGAILFAVEFFLISIMKESPTTEIMICRKISN